MCEECNRVNHHEKSCMKYVAKEMHAPDNILGVKQTTKCEVLKGETSWLKAKPRQGKEKLVGQVLPLKVWAKKGNSFPQSLSKDNKNSFLALNDSYALSIIEQSRESLPKVLNQITSINPKPSQKKSLMAGFSSEKLNLPRTPTSTFYLLDAPSISSSPKIKEPISIFNLLEKINQKDHGFLLSLHGGLRPSPYPFSSKITSPSSCNTIKSDVVRISHFQKFGQTIITIIEWI